MRFYNKLCKPAQLYLLISMVVYVVGLLQNLSKPHYFTMGPYSRNHENQSMILILQLVYIGIWTMLLNAICKINANISWFIVLFPFILYFLVFLALIFNVQEGMGAGNSGCKGQPENNCHTASTPGCHWNSTKN